MKKVYNNLRKIVRFAVNLVYSICYFNNIRIYLNNHITRGLKYIHEKKVKFPHPIGIVIGMKVELGVNCTIYQNVTIGTKDTKHYKTSKYPKIGNNVTIYPNSIIIGDVKIGDNAIIGAGSLVLHDVKENSIVAGVPAREIKR